MTNWTLETLEDFEGVFFDDGTGWKVLFEIHLAISLRHRYLSVGGTNFNTQISGIIWTDDDSASDSEDIKSELQSCYNAIVTLVNGNANFKWTESSGRSAVWTIDSMISDIGMGEFSDLLIRAQSPEPFVWLISAINRLSHPKILAPLFFNDLIWSGGSYSRVIAEEDLFIGSESSPGDPVADRLQEAWSSEGTALGYSDSMSIPAVEWSMTERSFTGDYEAKRVSKATHVSLHPLAQAGGEGPIPIPGPAARRTELGVVCLDYIYRIVNRGYLGGDLIVRMGSSEETDIGKTNTFPGDEHLLLSDSADLDFGGVQSVDLELITEPPTDVPFGVFYRPDSKTISVISQYAWVYCDLPEIMGAGELTAAIPAVSATAEQEE